MVDQTMIGEMSRVTGTVAPDMLARAMSQGVAGLQPARSLLSGGRNGGGNGASTESSVDEVPTDH